MHQCCLCHQKAGQESNLCLTLNMGTFAGQTQSQIGYVQPKCQYRGCSVNAYPAVTVSVASLVGASSRLIGPLTDAGDTAALS